MSAPRRLLPLLIVPAVVIGVRRAMDLATRDLDGGTADVSGAGVPLLPAPKHVGSVSDAHVVARRDEPEWVLDLAGWVPRAPRTRIGRTLAVIWASPSSAVGLLIGLLSLSRPAIREGVVLFAPVHGPVAFLLRRGGYAATTLGHVVLARHDPSPVLMAHELTHTRQAERLGPLMGPVYGYLLLRYGYVHHPMERAARAAARAVRHAASGHSRPTR